MSFLPHTIVGAVVGGMIPHPLGSFLAGVASHYVLDYIPHYDPVIKKGVTIPHKRKIYYLSVITVDVFCSLVLLLFLLPFPHLFWGGVGGAIVDIDGFLQLKFKHFPLQAKLGINTHSGDSRFHNKLKFSPGVNFIVGVLMQSVICLGGLYLLFLKIFPS
jgi:hypothetical protein